MPGETVRKPLKIKGIDSAAHFYRYSFDSAITILLPLFSGEPARIIRAVMSRMIAAFLVPIVLANVGDLPHQLAVEPELRLVVQKHVRDHQKAIVAELVELLAIPNVAADRQNIRRNAVHLREMLARRGFAAQLLETDGNPLVYGELKVSGASRTLLLYSHYDGQPVDPRGWKQPRRSARARW